MNYTHILELKEGNPNQYRITVVEDTPAVIIASKLSSNDDGFVVLGYYATKEEMLAVLTPYLEMEHSKGT